MKKFQFRLQTVLDYRSDQLELVQQKVAEQEAIRADMLQKIKEYDRLIEVAFQEQQEALISGFNPDTAGAFPNYIWRLKHLRFQEHQNMENHEVQILNPIRMELKQALIKKKSLDLLKAKQEKEYIKAIDKEEELYLAELTQNRFYKDRRKQKKKQLAV